VSPKAMHIIRVLLTFVNTLTGYRPILNMEVAI
jgi:hypothetical protein